jgi:glycosyltransferase involved in cell wall biosynthesis
MRILLLATQDLESPSGVGRYYPLARELAKRGHRVWYGGLHPDYEHLAAKEFMLDGIQVIYAAQMHVQKSGSQKRYFSNSGLVRRAAAATWALYKTARAIPAEIVHILKPHPMNSLAAIAARRGGRFRLLLDCDDQESASRFGGRWQRAVVTYFENHTPHRVEHITYHNSETEKFLLGRGIDPNKTSYLPNGVDLQRMQMPPEEKVASLRQQLGLGDRRVIAFIGSLSLTSHPINLLFDAIRLVQETHPQVHLLVVGGGDDFETLQGIARKTGIDERVTFTGRVPHPDIPLYYRLAEVIVDPVEDNLAGRTRLPIKLFESWALKVPFLTGDVGDRARVLGDPPAGRIVAAGSSEALAQEIRLLLDNKELCEQIIQRGSERSAGYNWELLAQQMETIYIKVLAGQAARTRHDPQHG